jgi:hypothetical protein
MTTERSGVKDLKVTETKWGKRGEWIVSGSIVFFVRLGEGQHEITIEFPFRDAANEADAYNQAIDKLHGAAAALAKIPRR